MRCYYHIRDESSMDLMVANAVMVPGESLHSGERVVIFAGLPVRKRAENCREIF